MCCDGFETAKMTEWCECSPAFRRRALSRDERIARLNEYKKQLELEIAGIEERIKKLGEEA